MRAKTKAHRKRKSGARVQKLRASATDMQIPRFSGGRGIRGCVKPDVKRLALLHVTVGSYTRRKREKDEPRNGNSY